jgi:hypothetical protein
MLITHTVVRGILVVIARRYMLRHHDIFRRAQGHSTAACGKPENGGSMWSRPWVAWLLGVTVISTGAGVLLAVTPASASAQSGRPGLVTAVQSAPMVTDVTGRANSKQGLAAPQMSLSMQRANARKQTRATALLRRLSRANTARTKCTTVACRAGLPVARDLAGTEQPQQFNYYCGPATASEMLAQLGVKLSQRKAADELGTSTSGTDWSDAAGYPMPEVLNKNQSRTQYVAVALPWSPTSKQIATFEADLVTDVNTAGGLPLAGNAYEVAGGPHLVGNPVNQTIMHWIDIRGYRNSGAVTDYEDSVHNATAIGWGLNVPAYSSLATSTIVDILGARGYDW